MPSLLLAHTGNRSRAPQLLPITTVVSSRSPSRCPANPSSSFPFPLIISLDQWRCRGQGLRDKGESLDLVGSMGYWKVTCGTGVYVKRKGSNGKGQRDVDQFNLNKKRHHFLSKLQILVQVKFRGSAHC